MQLHSKKDFNELSSKCVLFFSYGELEKNSLKCEKLCRILTSLYGISGLKKYILTDFIILLYFL